MCKKIRDSKRTFWLNVRKHGLLKVKPSDCVGSPYLDYCLDLCPYGMDDLDDPCKLLLTPMMNKRTYSCVSYMTALADLFFAATEWFEDDPRYGLDNFVVGVDSDRDLILLKSFCNTYRRYEGAVILNASSVGIKKISVNNLPVLREALKKVSDLASEFLLVPKPTHPDFEKNTIVKVKGVFGLPEESEFRIEGYWKDIFGRSWMDANGNPAAIKYAVRSGRYGIPLNDDVLYGKIGSMGVLVNVCEIVPR